MFPGGRTFILIRILWKLLSYATVTQQMWKIYFLSSISINSSKIELENFPTFVMYQKNTRRKTRVQKKAQTDVKFY